MAHIDAKQLTEVIETHGGTLTLYARQWCHTPDDAVQEALIDLARQDPPPDEIAAWLHTTVRRRAMNLGRAESRRDAHHRQAGLERDAWFVARSDHLDEPIDYETHLAQLPALDREIVVARIWGELTFTQIAGIVEQSLSTVHRRYQTALRELERTINQESSRHTFRL